MKIKSTLLLLSFLLPASAITGQSFQPAGIQYYLLPGSKAAKAGSPEYENIEKTPVQVLTANVRYPVRVKRMLITPELEYTRYFQEVRQWPASEDHPRNATLLGAGLAVVLPVGKKLAVFTNMGLSTGYQDALSAHQMLFRVNAGFIWAPDSLTKVGVSLAYSKVLNLPLPVFIFRHRFPGNSCLVSLALPMKSTVEFPLGTRTSIILNEQLIAGRFGLDDSIGQLSSYNTAQITLTAGLTRRLRGPLYLHLAGGYVILDRMVLFDQDTNKTERIRYEGFKPVWTASLYLKINGTERL